MAVSNRPPASRHRWPRLASGKRGSWAWVGNSLPSLAYNSWSRGLLTWSAGRSKASALPFDADDAGEIAKCQVNGVQAGNQRRAARFGFGNQQADGVQGQRRVEGGYRFVGQDQVRLLVKHAGDADALQLAAGELVATGEQLVGQVNTVECCPRPGDIERVEQGGQRFPGRPLRRACRPARQ